MILGAIRKHLGDVFHDLAREKGVMIEEGHLMPDHVHMRLSISPKVAVSNVVGFIKGKSAISIARRFKGRQRNFNGDAFWAKGYYVSTVGLNDDSVTIYLNELSGKFTQHTVTSNADGAYIAKFMNIIEGESAIGLISIKT